MPLEMTWLPPPVAFAATLAEVLQPALSPPKRLEALARLAKTRLSYLQTLQLDRAIAELGAPETGFVPMRIAVIGTATTNHLLPGVRVGGLRHGILFDLYAGAFGQYRQELFEPESPLYQFGPECVVLSITARDALARVTLAASRSQVDDAIERVLEDLRLCWSRVREDLHADVVQQTFLNVGTSLFGSYERAVPGAPARFVSLLNDRLAEVALADGVALLDVARASEQDGIDAWFDHPRWLQAKMEIAPSAVPTYGELLARVVAARRGLSRKCLVLDLDNTLWGGVLGDDGQDGLVLGEGSAAGEAHQALQRYVKQLAERGVILAVCSKNDLDVAEAAFRSHPEMILTRLDIAAFEANWEDKAENLRRIAERLNIGLDSLVFVDDNPVERARIRQSLPMVAVPELPPDVADYARCLGRAGYFEAVAFTSDDAQRGEQYAANAARDALRESAGTVDEFLESLEMVARIASFQPVDLARVTQLINKTNQFNPTARRYAAHEVAATLGDPHSMTLQARLQDTFGDNGIVSAMILRQIPGAVSNYEIESWVMSCRVFGRQLEHILMNAAVAALQARGGGVLLGTHLPTTKNGVVRGLYAALGFTEVPSADLPEGASRWQLDVATYRPWPTHITPQGEPL